VGAVYHNALTGASGAPRHTSTTYAVVPSVNSSVCSSDSMSVYCIRKRYTRSCNNLLSLLKSFAEVDNVENC